MQIHTEQFTINVKPYPQSDYPNVRAFLESKARNSMKTALSYRDGVNRLAIFVSQSYPKYDIESIIPQLSRRKIDVYRFLDEFVTFLSKGGLSPGSVKLFVAAIRSFLAYNGIDIIPSRFKARVTVPKDRKEDEYPLDSSEVRQILLGITNRRLKAYCLMLASGGMRPVEGLAIRVKDVDFTTKPTKLYMQAKYSKNKLPREVYISDEATEALKQWYEYKFGTQTPEADELVYAVMDDATPTGMYDLISKEFRAVLKAIRFDEKKEGLLQNRRKITLYSFRRYVKTITEDVAGHSMSEYLLGHKKSPYYTKKEPERREFYRKCLPYLTYLNYEALEQQGQDIQTKLAEREAQIECLQKQVEAKGADQQTQLERERQQRLGMQEQIQSIKARLEKTEQGYEEYREASKQLLTALATELEKKGAGKEEIISALAAALNATARPSTPEEIAEARKAKKGIFEGAE